MTQLSPTGRQKLHTALYQMRLQSKALPDFVNQRVGKAWTALQPIVEQGGAAVSLSDIKPADLPPSAAASFDMESLTPHGREAMGLPTWTSAPWQRFQEAAFEGPASLVTRAVTGLTPEQLETYRQSGIPKTTFDAVRAAYLGGVSRSVADIGLSPASLGFLIAGAFAGAVGGFAVGSARTSLQYGEFFKAAQAAGTTEQELLHLQQLSSAAANDARAAAQLARIIARVQAASSAGVAASGVPAVVGGIEHGSVPEITAGLTQVGLGALGTIPALRTGGVRGQVEATLRASLAESLKARPIVEVDVARPTPPPVKELAGSAPVVEIPKPQVAASPTTSKAITPATPKPSAVPTGELASVREILYNIRSGGTSWENLSQEGLDLLFRNREAIESAMPKTGPLLRQRIEEQVATRTNAAARKTEVAPAAKTPPPSAPIIAPPTQADESKIQVKLAQLSALGIEPDRVTAEVAVAREARVEKPVSIPTITSEVPSPAAPVAARPLADRTLAQRQDIIAKRIWQKPYAELTPTQLDTVGREIAFIDKSRQPEIEPAPEPWKPAAAAKTLEGFSKDEVEKLAAIHSPKEAAATGIPWGTVLGARKALKPQAEAGPPTVDMEVDAGIRQLVNETDAEKLEGRRQSLRESVAGHLAAMPKEEQEAFAGRLEMSAKAAREQAAELRRLAASKAPSGRPQGVGEWTKIRQVQETGEETAEGVPITRTAITLENEVEPLERDVRHLMSGHKTARVRATDPVTRKAIPAPKPKSPEEEAELVQYITGLRSKLQELLRPHREAGVDFVTSEERPAGYQDILDTYQSLVEATGHRWKYAGKSQPITSTMGVVTSPGGELTQAVQKAISGRAGKLAKWTPQRMTFEAQKLERGAEIREKLAKGVRAIGQPKVEKPTPPVAPTTPEEVHIDEVNAEIEAAAESNPSVVTKPVSVGIKAATITNLPAAPKKPGAEAGKMVIPVYDSHRRLIAWKQIAITSIKEPSEVQAPVKQLVKEDIPAMRQDFVQTTRDLATNKPKLQQALADKKAASAVLREAKTHYKGLSKGMASWEVEARQKASNEVADAQETYDEALDRWKSLKETIARDEAYLGQLHQEATRIKEGRPPEKSLVERTTGSARGEFMAEMRQEAVERAPETLEPTARELEAVRGMPPEGRFPMGAAMGEVSEKVSGVVAKTHAYGLQHHPEGADLLWQVVTRLHPNATREQQFKLYNNAVRRYVEALTKATDVGEKAGALKTGLEYINSARPDVKQAGFAGRRPKKFDVPADLIQKAERVSGLEEESLLQAARKQGVRIVPLVEADKITSGGRAWMSPSGKYSVDVEVTHNEVADTLLQQATENQPFTERRHDSEFQLMDMGWIRKAAPGSYAIGKFTSKALDVISNDIIASSEKTPVIFVEVPNLDKAKLLAASRGEIVPGGAPRYEELMVNYDDFIERWKGDLNKAYDAQRARQGQRGFITPELLGIKRRPDPLQALDPEVREVLKARLPLKNKFAEVVDWFKKEYFWEAALKDYPELQNSLRLAKEFPRQAANKSISKLVEILAPDFESKLTRRELSQHTNRVLLESLLYDAQRGLKVPNDLSVEQIKASLETLSKGSTPKLEAAYQRHLAVVKAWGQELVDRGKLDPEVLNAPYYPHEVLDYAVRVQNMFPNLPVRLKVPHRSYLRAKVGSRKLLNADYMDVMFRHGLKLDLHNSIEDFVNSTAEKYDQFPKLPEEMQQTLKTQGGLQVGRLYVLPDGSQGIGWQPDPGRQMFGATTINEKMLQEAAENGLTVQELLAQGGPRGGEVTGKVLAVGKPKPVYLLPEEIADRLTRFKDPKTNSLLLDLMGGYTGLWKRITLNFAGVPFQFNNLIGDLMNLYKTAGGAISKLPSAARAIAGSKKYAAIEAMAEAEAVSSQTGFFSGEAMGARPVPAGHYELARYSKLGDIGASFWSPLHMWETLSAKRESIPRLAMYMYQVDRVRRGKMVKATDIDVTGLDQLTAAAKIAREFTVDYGRVTPAFQGQIRGLLFPFATFYAQNAKNWGNYARKNPGNLLLKFGIPLAALYLWNNMGEREEVEKQLPEYMRAMPHLVTGAKTDEGKAIVISMQTPIDMAAKMGGIDKIPAYVGDIQRGWKTPGEATKLVLKDMALTLPRAANNLASPVYKVFQGLLSNHDPFSKRQIVPEHLKGTEQGRQLQIEFAVGQIFSPYAAYVRTESKPIDLSGEARDIVPRTLRDYTFNFEKALGVREVDLEASQLNRQYQSEDDATIAYKQKIADVEDAYVVSRSVGDMDIFRAAVQAANSVPGPKIPKEALRERLKTPRVQIRIILDQIQHEPDVTKREALVQRLNAFKALQGRKSLQQVPKGARGSVVIE